LRDVIVESRVGRELDPVEAVLGGDVDEEEDEDVDADKEWTTIVSTIPMARAASVSIGPAPLFKDEKKGLCLVRV
jgi:hypothetical protein